ncbi:MerR family transcriptional regulator [Sphingomonas sp. 1P06PA]|uniref:MerR family transcriptional regulator n=1 Tax=Sphingomonas sp. 1P06PA TaxID=554121 RepID=UPI0039A623BA
MRMRELEHRTGVSREVIRIMLRAGVLPEPKRLGRNRAEYGEAHVSGIAAVRELQTSSRMTLKEIKAALDGGGFQRGATRPSYVDLDQLIAGQFGLDRAPPVDIAILEERVPSARRDAIAFQSIGLLSIDEQNDRQFLSLTDARLVDIWSSIRAAGFVEEAGFPPENIAFYKQAAEFIAKHEVATFLGNNRVPVTAEQAAQMLRVALPLMLDFIGLLRLKAFVKALQLHLNSAAGAAGGLGDGENTATGVQQNWDPLIP